MTAFMWPAYIAKEGGYYEKYGLNARILLANHPAGVATLISGQADVNMNTLQQAMQLVTKDSSFAIFGSPLKKWLFALVGRKDIHGVRHLRGKRIGVTQIGGSTYDYALRLLNVFGMNAADVQWVTLGDNSRATALTAGSVHATMLSAPAYFALEEAGYRVLANIEDYPTIYAPNAMLLKKTTIQAKPWLPELLIKAHAEAVKRFYDDKPFAIAAYRRYDTQDLTHLDSVYDLYATGRAFDRVPYVLADSVRYIVDTAPDSRMAAEMQNFDYRRVLNNSIVDRLIQAGFFEHLFGPGIKTEQKYQAVLAFR